MIEAVCFSNEHIFLPSLFHANLDVCKYCGITRPAQAVTRVQRTCEHCGGHELGTNDGQYLCYSCGAPTRR